MPNAPFVTTGWLADHLGAPDVAIVEGSWFLPSLNRDPEAEFLAAHIPGAVRFDINTIADTASGLPHMLPSPEVFAQAAGALGISDDMTIVVYDGLGLFSAPRVWWTFRAMGARDVRILDGGFPRWRAEDRPVESGQPLPAPRVFEARLDRAAVAGIDDVSAALGSTETQVVDARPAERFRGEAPEPRPGVRPGHMPGSLNLPFGELVSADGSLRGAADLKAAFDKAGVDLNRPIVTTCGSGVTAALAALAAEVAGAPAPRVYDGSWAEWGSSDRPVASGPAK